MGEENKTQSKTLSWDSLPEEVLSEILSRVPVKSLLQLRCVSQTWNSLITSHYFVSAHLKQGKNQPLLLLSYRVDAPTHNEETRYSLRLDTGSHLSDFLCPNLEPPDHHSYIQREPFQIVGSCNGVVCLIDCKGYRVRKLILWNPSIRKCMMLPDDDEVSSCHGHLAVGFGFDSLSNDFKVVTIAGLVDYVGFSRTTCVRAPAKVGVYSCNAGYWKSFDIDLGTLLLGFWSRQQFVFNGVVHWLVCRRADGKDNKFILRFNLSDESFDEMMLPPAEGMDIFRWLEQMSIFLYEGCFAVLVSGFPQCELWVMEEYGVEKSWIKRFDSKLTVNWVAGFRSNGEILSVRERGRDGDTSLVSLDPRTHSINEIATAARFSCYFRAVPHVESLFMLDGTKLGKVQNRKRKERPPNVIPEMGKPEASLAVDGKSGYTSSLG